LVNYPNVKFSNDRLFNLYLSDRSARQRGSVTERHFFSGRDVSRRDDDHRLVGVEELSRVGHAVVVDARDRAEDGARANPLPADLVAVGVQDAADFLNRVRGEATIEE